MATPIFDLKKSQTSKQKKSMNKRSPVGIVTPNISKAPHWFRILSYLPCRVIVVLNPVPIGHLMSSLVNGSTSQPILIRDTIENPTYVAIVISDPLTLLSKRP